MKYHVRCENEVFVMEDGVVYRKNEIYRIMNDKTTGIQLKRELLKRNHARVMYDYDLIPVPVDGMTNEVVS